MTVTFDTETLRLMNLFENLTGARVRDCLVEEKNIYLVIDKGGVGLAIGRQGSNVKTMERLVKRDVKIVEFSADVATFVRNLIPGTLEIRIRNETGERNIVELKVERGSRGLVIGRDGKNLRRYKELLQRNHHIDELVVR